MFFRFQFFCCISLLFFLFCPAPAFSGPFLAICEHPKVRIRSSPTIESSYVTGVLDEQEEVFILEEQTVGESSYPWYKIQSLEKGGKGWVYGEYLNIISGQPSLTQQLAWQVVLDYGNTPEQARAIFGVPEKVKETVADGGKKEKQFVFVNYTAIYQDGILARVIIEQRQKAGFGKYFLGSPETDLLELSRRYIVDHDSLIFLNEQFDEFRFDLQSGSIARMVYHRSSAEDTFLPAWLNK